MASLSETIIFSLIAQCSPNVDPITMKTVMEVESAFNPYAVALVNSSEKIEQPKTLEEAVNLTNSLDEKGIDFSAGLMQINKRNFKGLELSNETVFDSCTNINAGAKILQSCYEKAVKHGKGDKSEQALLRDAMSCYYSGNFQRGYKKEGNKSYVDKINEKAEYKVPRIYNENSEENTAKKTVYSDWDVFKDF